MPFSLKNITQARKKIWTWYRMVRFLPWELGDRNPDLKPSRTFIENIFIYKMLWVIGKDYILLLFSSFRAVNLADEFKRKFDILFSCREGKFCDFDIMSESVENHGLGVIAIRFPCFWWSRCKGKVRFAGCGHHLGSIVQRNQFQNLPVCKMDNAEEDFI